MGVIKRGNIWWIRKQHNGKRIQKAIGPSKRKAEEAMRRLEAEIELSDTLPERKQVGFDRFCKMYLEYSQVNKSLSSFDRDVITVEKHLAPYFGKRNLRTITPDMIERFKSLRIEHVKPSTLNKELKTLKAMLNRAVDWNYLTDNPATKVKELAVAKKIPSYLSEDEYLRLLKACTGSRTRCLHPFVATGVYAGLRKGEMFHLTWSDVDLLGRKIHIQSKEDWTVKWYESRSVPICDALYKILNKHKPHPHSPYVFYNPDGSRFHDIRGSLKSAAKRAGIEHITVHMLRHTFASQLTMKGVDLSSVQELLGHADLQTTQIYSHVSESHLVGAVNVLS